METYQASAGNHSPKVGIVILNWNNYDDTARCLESLKTLSYPNYQIYLADNGSVDHSMERLMLDYNSSTLKFILNGENLGFAAGCNRGIAVALQEGCDYILLLNNDCIVSDIRFLEKAVRLAEATPACGIVGGKILFWPDTQRIWSTGGSISRLGRETYVGHCEIDRGQYEKIAERRFLSGALMLIKREVVDRIGMLPEAYFFGKEDWEYSARASRAGFTLLYSPEVTIYHEGSHSHSPSDPAYIYNGTLSKILYIKRQHARLFFVLWIFLYWLYLKSAFFMRVRLNRNTYLQGLDPALIRRAMLAAVRDSFRIPKITRDTLENFRRQYPRSSDL